MPFMSFDALGHWSFNYFHLSLISFKISKRGTKSTCLHPWKCVYFHLSSSLEQLIAISNVVFWRVICLF